MYDVFNVIYYFLFYSSYIFFLLIITKLSVQFFLFLKYSHLKVIDCGECYQCRELSKYFFILSK